MCFTAEKVMTAIGDGVAKAFKTSQQFLGVDRGVSETADIHPEYLTTVEVAKQFMDTQRIVSLETHMKELRQHAGSIAWVHTGRTPERKKEIAKILASYNFGAKDSKRIDIVVRPTDNLKPPMLIAEAKLGDANLAGIIQDIDRVFNLLRMYYELELLRGHHIYGAVVFHSMNKHSDTTYAKEYARRSAKKKATFLLEGVNEHLEILNMNPWLKSNADLLNRGAQAQEASGYHEDEYKEIVFAKGGFTFAPGLVLLGNADDVATVNFNNGAPQGAGARESDGGR